MAWRLSVLFTFLSVIVGVWLAHEVGLLGYRSAMASDKAEKAETLNSLHKSLNEKSRQLDEKETEILRRERAVLDKEKILTQQMERYEKVIVELKAKLGEYEAQKLSRYDSFRKVYEKMEPKKAAKILDDMELDLASDILGGMKQDKAAEILGKMSQDKARQVTEKYLGRTPTMAKPKPTPIPIAIPKASPSESTPADDKAVPVSENTAPAEEKAAEAPISSNEIPEGRVASEGDAVNPKLPSIAEPPKAVSETAPATPVTPDSPSSGEISSPENKKKGGET